MCWTQRSLFDLTATSKRAKRRSHPAFVDLKLRFLEVTRRSQSPRPAPGQDHSEHFCARALWPAQTAPRPTPSHPPALHWLLLQIRDDKLITKDAVPVVPVPCWALTLFIPILHSLNSALTQFCQGSPKAGISGNGALFQALDFRNSPASAACARLASSFGSQLLKQEELDPSSSPA